MRSKHGTHGATRRLILKSQPVHGTAHSVVVGKLLDGAWWREAGGGQIRESYFSIDPDLAAKGLKPQRTHRQLPQQDTYRRYIWSRCHAPSWGSRPEIAGVEGNQRQTRRRCFTQSIFLSFNCTNSPGKNSSVNSHRSEHPTQPEEYGARSSGCVCRCRHTLELFLKDKQVC